MSETDLVKAVPRERGQAFSSSFAWEERPLLFSFSYSHKKPTIPHSNPQWKILPNFIMIFFKKKWRFWVTFRAKLAKKLLWRAERALETEILQKYLYIFYVFNRKCSQISNITAVRKLISFVIFFKMFHFQFSM